MEESQIPTQNQGFPQGGAPSFDAPQGEYATNPGAYPHDNGQVPPPPYGQSGAPFGQTPPPPPLKPKKHPWVFVVIAVIAVLLIGGLGAGYYYYNSAQSEERAYSILLGNENVQDFEDYLNRFPNGAHAEEVRQRLEQLKTMYADWSRIATSEYVSDFERFKENYPASQLVKQCDIKIDSLDWVTAQKLNTSEAMAEYMEKHPEGRYISEAGMAQNNLLNTQVDDSERMGISETLNSFFRAFATADEATLCTYITPTMSQFLSKKNATKADVVDIVNRTYSEDIESCSFNVNDDYQITKTVGQDGRPTYKVSFSVDQHITRSGEGKTFGSYTANATLTGDYKISALTMREVSRTSQE